MRELHAISTCVVLALAIGVAAASAGGNSENAKLCQQGGWQSLVGADGTAFTNTGDCVSYAAQGGTFTQTSRSQLLCESFGGTFTGASGNVLWTCTNWTFTPGTEGFGTNSGALDTACSNDGGSAVNTKNPNPPNTGTTTCSS